MAHINIDDVDTNTTMRATVVDRSDEYTDTEGNTLVDVVVTHPNLNNGAETRITVFASEVKR